ncbi:MAG: fimbrillin family protein [Bacteroidetes bacterium]|nr:fimbrillin family protein [Bacteroidota bacterium]
MKKTLLFAIILATATFLSCSKDDSSIDNYKKEIVFNAYTNSLSKAEVVTDPNFLEFNVYSYKTDGAYSPSIASNIDMDNVEFSRENSKEDWKHEGNYFWPTESIEKLQFFAFSPVDNVSYSFLENSYPTFEYKINSNVSEQKDLVVSSLLDQEQSTNDGKIDLFFNHVLSQINFSLKGEKEGFDYTVTKIELKKIKNTGTFTFNATSGEWIDGSGYDDYAFNLTSDNVVNGKTPISLSGVEKTMILMPQKTDKGAKIKITYSVKQISTGTELFNGFQEKYLSSIVWKKNTKTNYNITLPVGCSDDLTFEVKISPWFIKR